MNYLQDTEFLEKLDEMRLRVQFARITTLEFFSEKPLQQIEGTITSGSITVNSSSSIRRTLNLSMYSTAETANIESLDNQISIDKKIKVEVGYKNLLKEYSHYGDIIWFPCGVYIISSASNSRGTSGWTISITAKDKMVQLNGEVGGMLAATTIFHERYEQKENGDVIITYPTIRQIIEEAVHHLGGEPLHNIFISDLDEEARQAMKYVGEPPIYFNKEYSSLSFDKDAAHTEKKEYQDVIGYQMTDFTYPGELTFQAGATVEQVLKKICETLGNFEYFYDVDGRFVFQEIKNYLNTTNDLTRLGDIDYQRFYTNDKYQFALRNNESVISINRAPKYDNLKNDFIVWGERDLPSGATRSIHYRLVIDEKPLLYYAKQYMFKGPNGYRFSFDDPYSKIKNRAKEISEQAMALQQELMDAMREAYENNVSKEEMEAIQKSYFDQAESLYHSFDNQTIEPSNKKDKRYVEAKLEQELLSKEQLEEQLAFISTKADLLGQTEETAATIAEYKELIKQREEKIASLQKQLDDGDVEELIGLPCGEWREELYRQALVGDGSGPYDAELLAEWRDLYDTLEWGGWNPDVLEHPERINFWLDFIGESAAAQEYSVNRIGRRTKVINNNKAKVIYNAEIPDIIFVKTLKEYQKITNNGGKAFFIQDYVYNYFAVGGQYISCYDEIRNMLYQNLDYNTTITISCLPKYYLEPNTILYIEDKTSGVIGNYLITQYTLPLNYSGTMSITAAQVQSRV